MMLILLLVFRLFRVGTERAQSQPTRQLVAFKGQSKNTVIHEHLAWSFAIHSLHSGYWYEFKLDWKAKIIRALNWMIIKITRLHNQVSPPSLLESLIDTGWNASSYLICFLIFRSHELHIKSQRFLCGAITKVKFSKISGEQSFFSRYQKKHQASFGDLQSFLINLNVMKQGVDWRE